MKGSNFMFNDVNVLYHKCDKINFKCGGSNINYQDCLEKKKVTINPKNKDDKCFQYAATVELNFDKFKKDPQRVSNIKPLINKYYWDGIKYASKIDDCKMLEKINPAIALNISYTKTMKKSQTVKKIPFNLKTARGG